LVSVDGLSGHWDKGQDKIDVFRCEHKCNSICHSLALDKEVNEARYPENGSGDGSLGNQAHPLHVGFD
jgi:hypothetical protein